MLSIVFKFWNDERAYERHVDLLSRQPDLGLLPASHMASVAYDKHIRFCEEYLEALNKSVFELWKDGPNEEALKNA